MLQNNNMRNLINLCEAAHSQLNDAEKHSYLQFIHSWLSGEFMKFPNDELTISQWNKIKAMFPPKIKSKTIKLYRLVTLPIEYAEQTQFMIKPSYNAVSSWSIKLIGLEAVAGIAREIHGGKNTCRIGITATVNTDCILATPTTMRDAFMALSHDYFDKYPETEVQNGEYSETIYKGYPEGGEMYMDDVGELQDVLSRPGGHFKQYECVVYLPDQIEVTKNRVYRVGDKILRQGNDDPYN